MNKALEKLLDKARELDWVVTQEDDTIYNFAKYSPAGQDFNMSIDTEDDVDLFLDNLYEYWQDYDPEQETMYWLDDTGHGKNGAPYHMRDLLDDMEACQDMIDDLLVALNEYKNEIEEDEQ